MAKPEVEEKLSRKIAELVMVIHTLFKKSHEQEIQINTIAKLCQDKVNECKQGYEKKIESLEKEVDEAAEYRRKVESELKDLHNINFVLKEEKMKMQNKEAIVSEIRRELDKKNDQILQLQGIIDNYKNKEESRGVIVQQNLLEDIDEKRSQSDLCQKYKNDIQKLKTEKSRFKDTMAAFEKTSAQEIQNLKAAVDNAKKEILTDRERISYLLQQKDKYVGDLKKMQQEKSTLRNKLKYYEDNFDQLHFTDFPRKVNGLPALKEHSMKSANVSREEELDKLREEVERYRMELVNREDNFNRVFQEKQPIITTDLPSLTPLKRSWNLTGMDKNSNKKRQLPHLHISSSKLTGSFQQL